MTTKLLILALTLTTVVTSAFAQTLETPKYKISGDLRYRIKGTTLERKDQQIINEIRARLGLQFTVNDVTKAAFRINTGTGGASSNQKLGANTTKTFEHKAFNLDQAYIGYKPEERVELMLGKTPNPFFAVGKSQLIWDSDISPDGLSLKTNFNVSEGLDLLFNAGSYWVSENFNSTTGTDREDIGIIGAQLGFKLSIETWRFIIGGGQTEYVGFKDDALVENRVVAPIIPADTNTFNPDGSYVYGYKLTELFMEVSTKFDDLEPVFFAHSVTNSEAAEKKTALWTGIGLNYGKFSGALTSIRSEKDAVVGRFTDSDLPGTDVEAIRYTAGYKVADNTQVAMSHQQYTTNTTITGQPIAGQKNTWTMLDVVVNF